MSHLAYADTPVLDPARLRVVASINLDDPDLRDELDLITDRTATATSAPVSLITVVRDDAKVVSGSHGLTGWLKDSGGTPLQWAFCAATVATGRPCIITDTANDEVHRNNPLVTRLGFAAYAGQPIYLDGQIVGAHSIIDTTPRTFTEREMHEIAEGSWAAAAILARYRH